MWSLRHTFRNRCSQTVPRIPTCGEVIVTLRFLDHNSVLMYCEVSKQDPWVEIPIVTSAGGVHCNSEVSHAKLTLG